MAKKSILLLAAMLSIGGFARAQQCATDEVHNQYKKIYPQVEKIQQTLDMHLKGAVLKTTILSYHDYIDSVYNALTATKLTIPVVVHVIHDYGNENVTDADIRAMISYLNVVYQKKNSDTANVVDPFKGYIGKANIEFRLAAKDPLGRPTNGIVRHQSPLTTGGDDQAKLDQWAPDRYFNIWVEKVIGRGISNGTILAYATLPSGAAASPFTDGVIVASPYINDSKKTIPHETGHYLNLYHPWNSSQQGASVACGDDEVDDTPPTKGHFGNPSGDCNRLVNMYDTNCANLNSPLMDGGFELLTTVTIPDTFDVSPNWSSLNSYTVNYDTVHFTFSKGFGAVGSSSLHLVTDSIKGAINNLVPGRAVYGQISTGTYRALRGYPDTSRPKRISGLYQYQINGSDNGFINVLYYKWNAGTSQRDTIATAYASLTGNVPSWKFFSLPLSYKSSSKADSVLVELSSSSENSANWAKGSYLDVDHLMFTDGSLGYYKVNAQSDTMDYPDFANMQNIMDYGDCPIMFTKEQVIRMRQSLINAVANRNNLATANNLSVTGVDDPNYSVSGNPALITADFSVEKVGGNRTFFLCGDGNKSFVFKNQTWNGTASNITWIVSNNATLSNPNSTTTLTAKISQPGWVSVKLAASNSTASDTVEKMVYAADPNNAIDPMSGYTQEFNPGTDVEQWPTFNYYNNAQKWQVVNNTGFYDNTCIMFSAYDNRIYPNLLIGSPKGDFDDFFTRAFNLSGLASGECNLSFMYSGASRTSDANLMRDTLEIAYSTDCGDSWQLLKRLTKSELANKGTISVPYAPLWFGDWNLRTISIPGAARKDKVFFRFRYKTGVDDNQNINGLEAGTGNNFYIDRINVNPFADGVNTLVDVNNNITLAPNPTNGSSYVIIKGAANTTAQIAVTDITGKVVYTTQQGLNDKVNRIEIPAAAVAVKGMYMVRISTGSTVRTEKLVTY